MKPTKEELIRAMHACINSYGGKYGEIVYNLFDTPTIYKRINHAKVAFSSCGETQYVIYEGSEGKKDWQINFTFWTTPIGSLTDTKKISPCKDAFPDIKLHTGMYNQYKNLRDRVLKTIEEKLHLGEKRIIITGHSLGADLAILCATDIYFNFPGVEIICLAFAAAKVGNKAFQKLYDSIVPDTYVFTYKNDMVCKVPFSFQGYTHVGHDIQLDGEIKWWERLFYPILKFIGNPMDHYPEKYLNAIKKLDW